jgi:hypothetical protein
VRTRARVASVMSRAPPVGLGPVSMNSSNQ